MFGAKGVSRYAQIVHLARAASAYSSELEHVHPCHDCSSTADGLIPPCDLVHIAVHEHDHDDSLVAVEQCSQ